MKDYIKKNITPILIGICIAFTFCKMVDTIEDVLVKFELIRNE